MRQNNIVWNLAGSKAPKLKSLGIEKPPDYQDSAFLKDFCSRSKERSEVDNFKEIGVVISQPIQVLLCQVGGGAIIYQAFSKSECTDRQGCRVQPNPKPHTDSEPMWREHEG